jgi:hypothetical protein
VAGSRIAFSAVVRCVATDCGSSKGGTAVKIGVGEGEGEGDGDGELLGVGAVAGLLGVLEQATIKASRAIRATIGKLRLMRPILQVIR